MGRNEICAILVWAAAVVVSMETTTSPPFAQARRRSSDPDSLNAFLHDYAYVWMEEKNPRTNVLRRVPLPSNLSGMEVSVIRLRGRTLWARGADFGPVEIPPGVLPSPYARRVVIVYQNLANWSSQYYRVPGHVLISPVVGLMTYNASPSGPKLGLSPMEDPISVRFPRLRPVGRNATVQCARFGANGSVRLWEMAGPDLCLAWGDGLFGAVIRAAKGGKRKEEKDWKWWGVGLGGGGVALALGLVVIWKTVAKRKERAKEMERVSEQGAALDRIWIGSSRMPSATGVRTLPSLEEED